MGSPSQRIPVRQALHFSGLLALLGDVLDAADDTAHLAVRKFRLGDAAHPAPRPRGGHDRKLPVERHAVADEPFHRLRDVRPDLVVPEARHHVPRRRDVERNLEDAIGLLGPDQRLRGHVPGPTADPRHPRNPRRQFLLPFEVDGDPASAQLVDGNGRQHAQARRLLGGKRSRLGVDHAERTEADAGSNDQRRAGVEADAHVPGHQRIFEETRVARRVVDDQHVVVENRIGTERVFAGRAVGIDAAFGQEFLLVAPDQRDKNDRHVEQALGQEAELIEARLGGPLGEIVAENFLEAFFFVRRNGIAGRRRC